MRLFHSLWTKPALDKRWDQSGQLEANLWLYTLSVIFAKQWGFDIVLHTDTLGKQLLGHLPYNQIYTTLDKIPSNIPTMIWAYGKFQALKEEPIGSIHIDGDVMITSNKCADKLKSFNTDVIVQCVEGSYPDVLDKLLQSNIVSKNFFSTNYAYNCGVVGFNSKGLKQAYLDFYFQSVNKIAINSPIKKLIDSNKYFCPDLPLEQWSLAVLSKNYKTSTVLKTTVNYAWGPPNSTTNIDARDIGYLHLIGKDKYKAIDKVKFYILALDKDLYYKTKEIIEKYKNILS